MYVDEWDETRRWARDIILNIFISCILPLSRGEPRHRLNLCILEWELVIDNFLPLIALNVVLLIFTHITHQIALQKGSLCPLSKGDREPQVV